MPRTTDSRFFTIGRPNFFEWHKCANRTTFQLCWNCKHTHT